MKRFHVHISVQDLAAAVKFYSSLFDAAPTVQHPDYAKWMLEDPRVNFAISGRGAPAGVNHLGLQVESTDELLGLRSQLQAADAGLLEQAQQACCYAQSDKYWVTDPAGVAWEGFHTLASVPTFNGTENASSHSSCCVPAAVPVSAVKKRSKTPESQCC
jgi:catechol 2,3-dioxygenase-like lactoylglutathione lyase family enzyme